MFSVERAWIQFLKQTICSRGTQSDIYPLWTPALKLLLVDTQKVPILSSTWKITRVRQTL